MTETLARLLEPVAVDAFFAEHWDRAPLHLRRGAATRFADLIDVDMLDRAAAAAPAAVKLADGGDPDKPSVGRGHDGEHVLGALARGASVVLHGLHRQVPALGDLCHRLEGELDMRVQANVYATPAGGRAFAGHYDPHDVFVLQVAGRKVWRVDPARRAVPHPEDETDHRAVLGDAPTDYPLEAGDLLYLPRGFAHDARAGNAPSIHITIGVLPYVWADVLRVALERLPAARRHGSLPAGAVTGDPAALETGLRDLLAALGDDDAVRGAVAAFRDEALSGFETDLGGVLREHLRATVLDLEDLLGARPGQRVVLTEEAGALVVRVGARRIAFAAGYAGSVRFCLGEERFRVADIPGDFDDDTRIALAERLLLEGLLRRPG